MKRTNNNILKIFAHKELKNHISLVQHSKIKFSNYYNTLVSNKCANIIRFTLFSSKLVFVSCQLEKGSEYNANRIRNIKEIHEKAFQQEDVGLQKSTPITEDDVIFIFGNMNTTISPKHKDDLVLFNKL